MATTNLVVDFLVIGITSTVWLAPALLYFFGTEWLCLLTGLSVGHVPLLLGVLYAVGIPVSRVADDLTKLLNNRVRDEVFGAHSTFKYHNQLNKIVALSKGGTDYVGYRRSIVRVSRACALNFLIGGFAWAGLGKLRPGIVADGGAPAMVGLCALIFVIMLHAWRQVLRGYFYSVRDIHWYLTEEEYWARRKTT